MCWSDIYRAEEQILHCETPASIPAILEADQ